MNQVYILVLFFVTIVYLLTLLTVFSYFGFQTNYYYIIIASYVAIGLYYYYKYSYYNLNTISSSEVN